MLTLSDTQLNQIREQNISEFETEMVGELMQFSPRHMSVLGDDGVLEFVKYGIERAVGCGFTQRGPIRMYLQTMVSLGSHFDEDPLYARLTDGVFTEGDDTQQMRRAKTFHSRLAHYFDEASGPNAERFRASSRRLQERSDQEIPENANVRAFVLAEAQAMVPERIAVLGIEEHHAAIDAAVGKAETSGITTTRGRAMFGILSLFAGCRFHDDLLYPWIARTLRNEALGDMDARAGRLEQRGWRYLDAMLRGGADVS